MGGTRVISRGDFVKYPFLPQAAKYVRELNLRIEDLASWEYRPILDRSESRIEEVILSGILSKRSPKDELEIASFPVAVIMVVALADSFLKKRYALVEAKRSSEFLRDERKEKIVKIAKNFWWKIRLIDLRFGSLTYEFALRFTDFLRNAASIQDKKWKIANRLVSAGEVYLTRIEVSRLLEEEIRKYIERRLDEKIGVLPKNILVRVERLKQLLTAKKGEIRLETFPEVVVEAFPLCMKGLYASAASGNHISHMGRFALTSFLTNVGMSVEDVINLFRSSSDFNERLTRYQVEHIVGGRGSGTKYLPPRCDSLRTHGICTSTDEICRGISHPFACYRIKSRMVKQATT